MLAYCIELRERIVAFIDEGNRLKDAVETFRVSYSSIHRLMLQREKTGELSAKPHGGGNPGRFKPEDLALLGRLSEEHSDSYLHELADMLSKAGGPTVHLSTICNRLKELGLTRKKKTSMRPSKTPPKCRRNAISSVKRSQRSIHGSWSSPMNRASTEG